MVEKSPTHRARNFLFSRNVYRPIIAVCPLEIIYPNLLSFAPIKGILDIYNLNHSSQTWDS